MGGGRRSRSVLVTGAASGIGADAAQRLASDGFDVALVDVDAERVAKVAQEVGSPAIGLAADVTDERELADAVATCAERFGGIDAVVANAAIAPPGEATLAGIDDLRRVLEVNLVGAARTVQEALPYLRERRGYALLVASLATAVHLPLMSAYAASKAGLEAYADSLRLEVARDGVDVGVAYFAWVDTPMLRAGLADPAAARLARSTPLIFARRLSSGEAGRAVARAVVQRRRRVVRPRTYWPVLLAPGVFRPLVEAYVRRSVER